MARLNFVRKNTRFDLYFEVGVKKYDHVASYDTMAKAEKAIKEIFENNSENMLWNAYAIFKGDMLITRYILKDGDQILVC